MYTASALNDLEPYVHKKTEKVYFRLLDVVNKSDDNEMILYMSSDYKKFYVRNKEEFFEKFEKRENYQPR